MSNGIVNKNNNNTRLSSNLRHFMSLRMTDSTVIWSVIIGIISFIWLVYTRLVVKPISSDDEFEGNDDLKEILKTVRAKDILDLPESNAVWNVGITEKAASVTDDTQLRLMEFRSEQTVDAEYIEALL